jgi:hypothetical protein
VSDFWDEAGGVVATVAPVLGTALGGPLGGAAAGILISALGLGKGATPAQVAAAVQGATPEQIAALKAADQAFLVRSMELASQVSQGQADTNRDEAKSGAWFIAGWRPFIGWVCGVALAWDQVVGPMIFSLIRTRWPDKDMLHIDSATLFPLLTGMLGIGAMRTIEKLNGVAGGEIIRTVNQREKEAARAPPPVPIVIAQPAPSGIGDTSAPPPPPPVPVPPPQTNRKAFFDAVRGSAFGGRLVQSQVDGCERILDWWDANYAGWDKRHLAYVLATVCWETGHTMQPIEEVGRGAGKPYGPQWYGRGLVQLTWERNYRLAFEKLGINLVAEPDLAKHWPVALAILFRGMGEGWFTGKKLADYFNDRTDDPTGAREIVNGHDHATEIAAMHRGFLSALDAEG